MLGETKKRVCVVSLSILLLMKKKYSRGVDSFGIEVVQEDGCIIAEE
jgi:hypothetical protein